MKKPAYSLFEISKDTFMRNCPFRENNRRCALKSYCQNLRDGSGRKPEELEKAKKIYEDVMQHVAHVKQDLVKLEEESAESQLRVLMSLVLCVKHQDCCDMAVEFAMEMLDNECQRPVAVKQFTAPKQSTANLQRQNNSPLDQEQYGRPHVLSTSFNYSPASPTSAPSTAFLDNIYSLSFYQLLNSKHADLFYTAGNSSNKCKEKVISGLPKRESEDPIVSTRPIMPVANAQPMHCETTPSPVDKVKHLFADYPREETRKSALDQLLENFETTRVRMDNLEGENLVFRERCERSEKEDDKLRARCESLEEENDQLRNRCEKLEIENDQLQDRCESLTDENAKLNRQLKKLQRRERGKLQAGGKNPDGNE